MDLDVDALDLAGDFWRHDPSQVLQEGVVPAAPVVLVQRDQRGVVGHFSFGDRVCEEFEVPERRMVFVPDALLAAAFVG